MVKQKFATLQSMGSNDEEAPHEGVGERVRRLREAQGWSEAVLAGMIGLTEAAIKKLESSGSKAPSFPNGLLMAQALGVSAWMLAFGTDPPVQAIPGAQFGVRDMGHRLEIDISPGYELIDQSRLNEKIERMVKAELKADLDKRFTLPEAFAETVSRLPEGPTAQAFREVQVQLDSILKIAKEARDEAAAAKKAAQRGRDKSA